MVLRCSTNSSIVWLLYIKKITNSTHAFMLKKILSSSITTTVHAILKEIQSFKFGSPIPRTEMEMCCFKEDKSVQ